MNQVSSIKCAECGLVHFYSRNGVCSNCGSFHQLTQPKKRQTTVLIIACAAIIIFACVVFVSAAGHKAIEQSGNASGQPTVSSDNSQMAGLMINEIESDGPADKAGLKLLDIIIQYGDIPVLDKASFFRARDVYAKRGVKSVEIVVGRVGGRPLKFTVPPGRLGIFSDEYNTVLHQFNSMMRSIEVLGRMPHEQLERSMTAGMVTETPTMIAKKAEQLIDQAEQEGTLTREQILAARIYMIPDEATPKDEARRQELLQQLLANQSADFANSVGQERFFENKKYRAAAACLNQYLQTDPSDVSARLNLGIAYNHLSMFKEADAAASYVAVHKLPLSTHGYVVMYEVKAFAAMGNGDYRSAMAFVEKSFDLSPNDYRMSLWQLAAAQSGDIQQFYSVKDKCREIIPDDYERLQFQVDAVEAYALVKSNHRDRAQELVNKWKEPKNFVNRVNKYWREYPGGSDVIRNWEELASVTKL